MFRALEWVSAKAMTIAGWCYLVITLLICFDIAARRLLGFSTEATTEITGYLMAATSASTCWCRRCRWACASGCTWPPWWR